MQNGGWNGPAVSQDAVQEAVAESHRNHDREKGSKQTAVPCTAQSRALMSKMGVYRKSNAEQILLTPRQCQPQETIP